MPRQVIMYELNEVPWPIIDLYTRVRPASALARALPQASCLTTICDDPEPLQPWRTWPALHSSMYTRDHNSYDLGQDPFTFRGEPIWDVASDAGRVVGIFGPMQSWPPRTFANGGFYIPDTFARSAATDPPTLERFQAFNLTMTRENTFSPSRDLSLRSLAAVGVDLLRLGLSARSLATISHHIFEEFRDDRHQAARSAMQALPSFDLYWRLHRQHSPDLSIFFTNHVAGMMHRYWGDGFPGYNSSSEYKSDPVYATFLVKAMDIFDRQLAAILKWAASRPNTIVLVTSSMGQGAISKESVNDTFVLDDAGRLSEALGFDAEVGSAMYPRTSYHFDSQGEAAAAVEVLGSVQSSVGDPLFQGLRVIGRSLSLAIDQTAWSRAHSRRISWAARDHLRTNGDVTNLGISVRTRTGGGNTAYHTPEGVFISIGAGVFPDNSRSPLSLLNVAPSVLKMLEVEIPHSYKGEVAATLNRNGRDQTERRT